jgi:hypothetical protein
VPACRYHSIRIDSVHYCEREIYLSENRKRRSFFDRNAEPEDTAQARLKLLSRTLREDPTRLGSLVRFFKTPYMLRESCQSDLARTIAVTPHLLYVDLPEGLFSDDPQFATLRLEVQARCPDIRKMTYIGGSERSLEQLSRGNIWRNLEVLELIRINMDPSTLRRALAAMGNLHALKITETKAFSNDIFADNEMLPPFPVLAEFVLTKTPRVTSAGLVEYLSRPDTRKALKVLTLCKTGVSPSHLQEVLAAASCLKTLAITEHVSSSFHREAGTQLLASPSLRTLRYEISAEPSASPFSGGTASYYNYLAASLLSGNLPNLRAVYVRDPGFPDQLLGLAPPIAPFAFGARPSSSSSSNSAYLSPPNSGGYPPLPPPISPNTAAVPYSPRFSSNNPFAMHGSLTRTLEVFTKSDDGMDWSFVKVSPSAHAGASGRFSAASAGPQPQPQQRPVSSYGLGADVAGMGWSNGATRRSVMVGNGAGGFLAIPNVSEGGSSARGSSEELWPRPVSSAGEKRRGEMDLWR